MIKILKKYIQSASESCTTLNPQEKEERIKVAVCALLLEVAHADDEFSSDERDHIMSTIKDKFEITDQEAKGLLQNAETERSKSIDLWHFTNLINDNYSIDEKFHLIELLWEIVYADETLDQHEDYLLHKLQYLLNLDHEHLIAAKLRAKSKK